MAYSSGNPFGFVLTPWVKRLIIANVVVFVIVAAFGGLRGYLVFTPSLILRQPWTLATYMFVHVGLFHLLFNMLTLFFFGPPLEDRWGSREFLKFYLIAGAGGALLSFLFLNYSIAGASAAVFGVMVGFAMNWPESPIYIWGIFPVKAKWLVTALVAINLFLIGDTGSNVAYLAHIGGALAAFAYLKSPLAPPAWGAVPTSRRQRNWTRVLTGIGRSKPKEEEHRPTPAPIRKREPHTHQDEVDRILDKISKAGMASLTDEERRRLEEASRKYRAN